MTIFYIAFGCTVISLLFGIILINSSLHRRQDAYASLIPDDKDANLKIARIQMKTGIISCVFSGLSLLVAVIQLVITITGSIPKSPAITVRTVATLKSSGDVVLECETTAGNASPKTIPLYQSSPGDDIKLIDVKGVAQLTVSAEDLRRLFSSGKSNEVTATVVVKDPDDPQGIVEVALTKNGQIVDIPMRDMVLYLPHQEDDPTKAVAQRVWEAEAFEPGAASLIPCSVAGDKTVAIPLTSSAQIQIVSRDPGFTDGPFEEEAAVNFTGSHGILHGVGGGRFSPRMDMTRGGVVTALYNMAGNPWVEPEHDAYSDVSEDSWYEQAIAWALEEEIAVGVGHDQFLPDDHVTRGQFALMLWRYSGKPAATSDGLSYTDLKQAKGDEYIALCWMLQEHILTDTDGKLIRPGDNVTREDAAVMLMRLCGWLIGMDAG